MVMTTAPLSAVLRLGLTPQIQGPSVDGSFLPHGQPPGRPSAPGSQEPRCEAARLQEVSSWGDRRSSTIFGRELEKWPYGIFFTSTTGRLSPRPFISPCSLVPPQTSEIRSFLIDLQPGRHWLCGISEETESCFCSVLLSNLRGQQPHGEHRPSSQEDMEALTSQVGEEISEVCPCPAPGTYRRCERLEEWPRGRRFQQAAFVAFLNSLMLEWSSNT